MLCITRYDGWMTNDDGWMTNDVRRMPSDCKSSDVLWPGELKIIKKNTSYISWFFIPLVVKINICFTNKIHVEIPFMTDLKARSGNWTLQLRGCLPGTSFSGLYFL